MTDFWIYSGVLVAVAASFIVFPIYQLVARARGNNSLLGLSGEDERQHQNVVIFRERLIELEAELQQGKLDAETFEALKEELEESLLSDVSAPGGGNVEINRHPGVTQDPMLGGRTLIFSSVMALIVAVSAYAAYFQWGSYDEVLQAQTGQPSSPGHAGTNTAMAEGDVNALLDQLYTRLTREPDNVDGWMLFSRSAMKLEQYDRAIEGFGVVIELFEQRGQNSALVYGLLAQALYFRAGGQLTHEVKKSLEKALEIDPDEVGALVLMAMHAFGIEDYTTAIQYWQRILVVAPDHPAKASIEEGIARAQQLAGIDPSDAALAEKAAVVDGVDQTKNAGITVTVSLDPQLASRVAPGDTVFIFAQAESGSRMPLAASRHHVSDLPVTVLLNDATSMGPMAKLSQVKNANIIARISKSGQAFAGAGDLEGRVDSVGVFTRESVSVVIQTVL